MEYVVVGNNPPNLNLNPNPNLSIVKPCDLLDKTADPDATSREARATRQASQGTGKGMTANRDRAAIKGTTANKVRAAIRGRDNKV